MLGFGKIQSNHYAKSCTCSGVTNIAGPGKIIKLAVGLVDKAAEVAAEFVVFPEAFAQASLSARGSIPHYFLRKG